MQPGLLPAPPAELLPMELIDVQKTVALRPGGKQGRLWMGDACALCKEGIWQAYHVRIGTKRMDLCGDCYRRERLKRGEGRG